VADCLHPNDFGAVRGQMTTAPTTLTGVEPFIIIIIIVLYKMLACEYDKA
jgi:hypothetical protein